MRSMTGFGRAVGEADGNVATVEIAAVNGRKQTDIRLTLPRDLAPLEPGIKQAIQDRVRRGSITATVAYTLRPELRADTVALDTDLAKGIVAKLRALAEATGVEAKIQLSDLLQIPGIMRDAAVSPVEAIRGPVTQAVDAALDALRQMQKQEGDRLQQDIRSRVEDLFRKVAAIAGRANEAIVQHRDRLRERIALLGVDLPIDDDRLAREVAFCAEKSDITEEVVRLRSHLEQFAGLIEEDRDVGRELDFLCQEMNREVTTIGSKTADPEVAETAIMLKAEIARVREQIMNIE